MAYVPGIRAKTIKLGDLPGQQQPSAVSAIVFLKCGPRQVFFRANFCEHCPLIAGFAFSYPLPLKCLKGNVEFVVCRCIRYLVNDFHMS